MDVLHLKSIYKSTFLTISSFIESSNFADFPTWSLFSSKLLPACLFLVTRCWSMALAAEVATCGEAKEVATLITLDSDAYYFLG